MDNEKITISKDEYVELKKVELKYTTVLNTLFMDAVIAGDKVELATYKLQDIIRALEPELINQAHDVLIKDAPF